MSNCIICNRDGVHDHNLTDQRRWIGVDFDNTLAYNIPDRTDPYTLGEPIPSMVDRVKRWLELGITVKLFTARMCLYSHTGKMRDIHKMEKMLYDWCIKHIGRPIECTNQKDGYMEVLWDDRTAHFDEYGK